MELPGTCIAYVHDPAADICYKFRSLLNTADAFLAACDPGMFSAHLFG
jgi:hypothetical protein